MIGLFCLSVQVYSSACVGEGEGGAWWQDREVEGHIVSTVMDQRAMNAVFSLLSPCWSDISFVF